MESNVFNCGHCAFNTTSIANLEQHLKTKHPEPEVYEYRCRLCNYCTTVQRNLKRHFANRHAKEVSTVHVSPSGDMGETKMEVAESKRDEDKNESKTLRNETQPPIQARNDKSQPKKDDKMLNDILKVCIRCSVCEFMCNSLRSMSEHIESEHSSNSNPQSDAIGGMDSVQTGQPLGGVDTVQTGQPLGGVDSVQTDQPLPDVASDIDATFDSLNDGDQGGLMCVFVCSLCNKIYDQNWKLTRHMKTTHPSNYNLDQKQDQTETVDFEHENADASLTEETFRISNANSPTGNQISQSRKKPSTCPICERVLYNQTNLKRHMMSLHPNDLQIKKDWDQPDNLPLHVEIATPTPAVMSTTMNLAGKFECNICNSKFTRRFTLKQHQNRLHSMLDFTHKREQVEEEEERGMQPFFLSEVNCSICNRNFDSNEALQRHNLRRHKEVSSVQHKVASNTVYTCNICNEKVTGKINLVNHVKKFHHNTKREINFDDDDIVEADDDIVEADDDIVEADDDIVEADDDLIIESGPDPKKQKADIGQGLGRQPKRDIQCKNKSSLVRRANAANS